MAEGIRAPNLPLGTNISEFLGIETVGTAKSVKRFTRANVLGTFDAVVSGFQAGGGVIFTTKAQANTALNYDANKMAWVIQDPTPANNGVYQKSGASGSGSWTKVAELPYSFYRAVNEGAGTANAIVATNGYPMANKDALIVLNITATNTSEVVTISLNGGAPLTIKTAAGNPPAVGGLATNMVVAGYIEGNCLRLLSDQASSAIQAAAEAAQIAAEAARDVAVGAMSVFTASVFSTKALAETSNPPVAPSYIRLEGYMNAGDGGGELYTKVTGEPPHAGKFSITLSDGVSVVWYELTPLNSYVNVRAFGAVGKYGVDDFVPLQNACDYSVATDRAIFILGNFYTSLPWTINLVGGAIWTALQPGAAKLIGVKGLSWIRLMDNQSTDANPKAFNLLSFNTVVDGFLSDGISYDLNGQNNKISPDRASGTYNPYNCAAIFVSGTVASGGVDARMTNSRICNGIVKNSPGLTCIGLGQAYGAGMTEKGYDVEIYGMRFENNGIDAGDHSSIYAFCNSVNVHDCVFTHSFFSTGIRSPVVAMECHGSRIKATNNTIENYCQMFWIAAGEDGVHGSTIISHNSGTVNYIGIGYYDDAVSKDGVIDADISNNTVTITGDPITNPTIATNPRVGISIVVRNGFAARISAKGNNLRCTDRTNNIGIFVGADNANGNGALVSTAMVDENVISGFSRGVYVQETNGGVVSAIGVNANRIEDCANVTPAITTFGIGYNGAVGSPSFKNNWIGRGVLNLGADIGISLAGTAVNLGMNDNEFDGVTTEISDGVLVSGRRTGRQARLFAALPTQSTWLIGDEIYNTTPSILGASPDKYTLKGWMRVSSGPGNVLNSDWVEQRSATGY